MTQQHPDLAEEQAYIDHAYDCLEQSRTDAWKLRDLSEATLGGTFQARYERDVFDEALVNRLTKLDLGDAALVFGRIDRLAETPDEVESFHIGRLAVADDNSEPVVVDWRAPVAEPFYRATGREPMGLRRRRHFAVQSRTLLGLEDELFGDGHLGLGDDEGIAETPGGPGALRGYSTLLAALERGRTGQLGDIVATIQAEQDEIIRSPQAGVLVVQGGPGTGKTVVALHRAAYLLYTYRFPLEDQGVLVIGPNRVFLRYIERVLPSLGEAGVEQVVLNDLVPDVDWARYGIDPADGAQTATVKGDLRMADVIDKAVTDRERGLRDDLVVPFRSGFVRLRAEESLRIVKAAQRRFRRHNAARRWVEGEIWSAMAAGWRDGDLHPSEVREGVRSLPEVRIALERMWPVLTPAQLLHDLFGSKALLRLAAERFLAEDEYLALHRPRAADVADVRWTDHDVALLDEARHILGPRPPRKGGPVDEEEIRTYGHIVIDEVQDLTPMQLRMAARRSLNGSMTVVGDIAQATGALAPDDWDDVLAHLPDNKPSRVIGLSVGYRIPDRIMELANRVMMAATPTLRAPVSVRAGDERPEFVEVAGGAPIGDAVAAATRAMAAGLPNGSIAVVVPDAMVDGVSEALTGAGVDHGRATRSGLSAPVTVVPVSVVKGLELDGVVVVEPAAIVAGEQQGLRALYVALTRSTRRLTIVHAQPLPESMR
ncbi:MAG: ATP-binding domain-containing protein [Acidimicrobiales bacterium]|nr:ATP-binding domain-containing protein [Acidimicrobiales bacterium]